MQIVVISMQDADWRVASGWAGQKTARTLLEARIDFTLAVPLEKFKGFTSLFPWGQPIVALPKSVKTMAEARDAVLYDLFPGQGVCMMDDDLTFYARDSLRSTKMHKADLGEVRNLFFIIEDNLTRFLCVGLPPMTGGTRHVDPVLLNTRVRGVVAYRAEVVKKCYLFSPVEHYDVDHMTLQILRGGQDVLCLNQWGVRGGPTELPGVPYGGSLLHFVGLHPGFAKVDGAGNCRIQWKQARRAAE